MMDYAIYDVFTDSPLAGNPLAVVYDADHLDTAQMHAITQEFNLSETVFIQKAENPVHGARLRIFTPGRELPFAGHPTVGAAVALAERKRAADGDTSSPDMMMVLEENIGPVRCVVSNSLGKAGFAEFDLPQPSRQLGVTLDKAQIGAALGIDLHEIGFENHRVSTWSAGVAFVLVPVSGLPIVAGMSFNPILWEECAPAPDGGVGGVYIYCRGGQNHLASFHARMFWPSAGISEDPATGSAVAALSGAIQHFDDLREGHHAMLIEQGVEMGRPSHIHLNIDCAGGEITRTRIGGHAVRVAEGQLFV